MTHDGIAALKLLTKYPAKVGRLCGFKKLTDDIHNEWLDIMINGTDDTTIQAHRGSYKTSCLIMAIVIIMIVYAKKNIIFMRKSDADVAEVVRKVRSLLESDAIKEITARIYGSPVTVTRANATEITCDTYAGISGAAQLIGIGTGGSITGKHADIVITDDIVNQKDRVSRAERERIKLIYQELQNIKNRGGRIINTGTPWHADDAFSIMPVPLKWDCYSTGLLTQSDIDALKNSMTSALFATNYELRHIAEDDVIFIDAKRGGKPDTVVNGTAHVDAAYYGEDYTAYTIANMHDGILYVYGRCWRRPIDEVTPEIAKLHDSFKGGKLYIERNADKGYAEKDLRKLGIRAVGYNESQNKHMKIVTHLKGAWQNICFVDGTDEDYINQILDYNEDAEHDDCPDSLASLIRKIGTQPQTEYVPTIY